MSSRVILIGCGSAKASKPAAAEILYTSQLFRLGVAYAKASGQPWAILSAKFGLLDPLCEVAPYELCMGDLERIDRCAWALSVALRLLDDQPDYADPRRMMVELHAGAEYCDMLADVLMAVGVGVSRPTKGLGIGERMKWLKDAARVSSLGLLPSGVA